MWQHIPSLVLRVDEEGYENSGVIAIILPRTLHFSIMNEDTKHVDDIIGFTLDITKIHPNHVPLIYNPNKDLQMLGVEACFMDEVIFYQGNERQVFRKMIPKTIIAYTQRLNDMIQECKKKKETQHLVPMLINLSEGRKD